MSYTQVDRKGQQAVMYWAPEGTTTWTELGIVHTNAFALKRAKITGNIRASKQTNNAPGQFDHDTTFTGRRRVTNAGYQAFKARVKPSGSGIIGLKFVSLSGDEANEVIFGDYMIEEISYSEEMNGFQDFTGKCAANTDTRETSIT